MLKPLSFLVSTHDHENREAREPRADWTWCQAAGWIPCLQKAVISDGDMMPTDWATLDAYLMDAEPTLTATTLDVAAGYLQQACFFFP